MKERPIKMSEIREAVTAIRVTSVTDAWTAHRMEDDLYVWVLSAIAEGTVPSPKAAAREALKTLEIEFRRQVA